MKRWFALSGILACVIVLAAASVVLADVRGTHHDMNTFVGASKDTCYPCHGFQELSFDADLGKIGSLCYARCHVGTGSIISTGITLQDALPRFGSWNGTDNILYAVGYSKLDTKNKYTAHLFTKANVPGSDNTTMADWPAWPYTQGASPERIECTSCHDVHSNTYTPFLRANLSDNNTPSASFCMQCHRSNAAGGPARWTIMVANTAPNGGHPIEAPSTGQAWSGDTQRKGRALALKDQLPTNPGDNSIFRNYTLGPASMGAPGTHFVPGGKLGNVNQTGLSGVVGCYTCHATHIPAEAGGQQLTVAPWKMSGTTRTRSEMCIGCHGPANTDGRNPGITNYFHPCNGETRAVDISTPTAAQYNTTTPGTGFAIYVNISGTDYATTGTPPVQGTISCSSCHGDTTAASKKGVHDLAGGTMLLNPNKPQCSSCHDGTGHALYQTGDGAVHHPIGGTTTESGNWATAGFRTNFAWNATDNAILSDGLGCADCHTFNGTAHNWN